MRTARFTLPGSVYHCIWRFVDREWFFTCAEERETYLRMLGHAMEHTDWRCLAYALMSNHIHVAVIAGRLPMSSWTKATNSPFARWMNRRHGRLGPVFADRAKDYQAKPGGTGELIAYIHNNPVKAGVVLRASQSDWTSHRAYAGLCSGPPWLAIDEGLARSGFDDPANFDAWVDVTPGESAEVSIERQRRLLRRLGSVQAGTPTTQSGRIAFPVMARSSFHVRPDPHTVIDLVAELCALPATEVKSRRRLRQLSEARRIAAYCARAFGITPSDTAAALGISAQAVGAMLRKPLGPVPSAVLETAIGMLGPAMAVGKNGGGHKSGETEVDNRPSDIP